uniref:Glycosyltransferase 2-like domain-containing protein n=1 Tax=Dictyoglomus turgidum TaxID=513050 RepID=A0A7C3WXW4_9BACT
MAKSVIVSPVHKQPSLRWIEALPNDVDIIIVDDSNGKVKIDKDNVELFDYKKQQEEAKDFYPLFELFHRSAACKNFGLWLAYKRGYDVVIVIDSDCILPLNFVEKHLEILNKKAQGWVNPLDGIDNGKWFSRGFPYSQREKRIVVNMGLWSWELDINGVDKIGESLPRYVLVSETRSVVGKIPFSGMNFAIRREVIPALLFLPNYDYKELRFRRHDDIWGGYIMQKLIEKRNEAMTFGPPIIYHETEVDPIEDAINEEAMNFYSDSFYSIVDEIMKKVRFGSYQEMFKQFADNCYLFKKTVFEPFIYPIKEWSKLWQNFR